MYYFGSTKYTGQDSPLIRACVVEFTSEWKARNFWKFFERDRDSHVGMLFLTHPSKEK